MFFFQHATLYSITFLTGMNCAFWVVLPYILRYFPSGFSLVHEALTTEYIFHCLNMFQVFLIINSF